VTFVADYPPLPSPIIDYGSRDYAAVYADLTARIPNYMSNWTSTSQSDFGIALLQVYAYVADLLNYYLDRLAGEAFIQTATQAVSILNFAQMLDYVPTLSVGATASLTASVTAAITSGSQTGIPANSVFATAGSSTQAPIQFLSTAAVVVTAWTSGQSWSPGAYITYNGAVYEMTGESQITDDTTAPSSDSANWTAVTTVPVLVQQGTLYSNEEVGTSDGTVNQSFPLQNNPVSAGSFSVTVDIGQGPQTWTNVPSLLNYGPTDEVYTYFVDANSVFYINFGDGVNGLVPPLGSPITATYQTNVGATGNVGGGQITQIVSPITGVTAVTNAAPSSGGADAESLQSIQTNAPLSLRALNRAVAPNDAATLALGVPGVQWASEIDVTYQLINLYIAPTGGGQPSESLIAAVTNLLAGPSPLLLAGATLSVYGPTYVPVNMAMSVTTLPNYSRSSVQAQIVATLGTVFSLANTGFAVRVSLAAVYQLIYTLPGVAYLTISSLYRTMLTTLTSQINSGVTISSLSVAALPQAVNQGDTLVLNGVNGSQNLTVGTGGAVAGATSIPISGGPSASYTYPITTTTVSDTSLDGDAVFLNNEIPTAGTFIITMNSNVGLP
jgi:hypothetical protein